jgi:hypothetical protein
LMRMLSWPWRFPLSGSRRLPGGTCRSLRQAAASRMGSLRKASLQKAVRAKLPKRRPGFPSMRAWVSRQRNDLITPFPYNRQT